MIIVSTKPLIVFFEKGFVVLDRFNNKVPFIKSIISINKLKRYLIKNKIINEYHFNMIMNRIKKNTSFLNFLAKDDYYKDPRYFHTIALDYVLDSDM